MSVLKVIEWPNPVLTTKASEVEVFDDKLKQFVADMHETMKSAGGIGLAANQVNSLQRVLVINIPYHDPSNEEEEEGPAEERKDWHDKTFTFINPVITKKQGKTKYMEGCLSFPEMYDFVNRAAEVWVKYQDENGKEHELHADGLMSICIQHEIDHIDGIVFIDRMSRLKANGIIKKMQRTMGYRSIEAENT